MAHFDDNDDPREVRVDPSRTWTEADVRRIVRDEINRATIGLVSDVAGQRARLQGGLPHDA